MSKVVALLVNTVSGCDGPILVQQSGAAFVKESGRPPLTKRNLFTHQINIFIIRHEIKESNAALAGKNIRSARNMQPVVSSH